MNIAQFVHEYIEEIELILKEFKDNESFIEETSLEMPSGNKSITFYSQTIKARVTIKMEKDR